MTDKKFAFLSSEKAHAMETAKKLRAAFGHFDVDEADIIVAVGGDGFMLETLRASMSSNKPIYGVNCGTVGFLMNAKEIDHFCERVADAEPAIIHPLAMTATTVSGETHSAHAINEVSMFRQTRQSATPANLSE